MSETFGRCVKAILEDDAIALAQAFGSEQQEQALNITAQAWRTDTKLERQGAYTRARTGCRALCTSGVFDKAARASTTLRGQNVARVRC